MRHAGAFRSTQWRKWLPWVFLYGALAAFLIYPYFRFNSVLQWDAPGHLGLAWYIRHYLWPWPVGWNPFFFTGYPQGTFYPPLFHYLVASLSFVVPLLTAFKVVVAVAVLATPISFFLYVRHLGFTQRQASIASWLMFAICIVPISYSSMNNAVGGTLYSTFDIGLVVNGFALPLVFFYLAALHTSIPGRRVLVPTILLAAIILTHVYAAIGAITYSLIFFLSLVKKHGELKVMIQHLALTALLTAWWWFPFLLYRSLSASVKIGLVLGGGGFIFLVVGLAMVMWLLFKNNLGKLAVPGVFFTVATFGLLFVSLLNVPIHTYRLILFPMLMIPLFVVQLHRQNWYSTLLTVSALAFVAWGFWRIEKYPGFSVRGPQQMSISTSGDSVPDRAALLVGADEQLSPHVLQYTYPLQTESHMLEGLFVESSATARYMFLFERLIEQSAWVWGIPVPGLGPQTTARRSELIPIMAKYFGVNTILSPKDLSSLNLKAAGQSWTYSAPYPFVSATIAGRTYIVPDRDAGAYIVDQHDHLVLVTRNNLTTNITVFKPTILQAQSVLQVGSFTYYIHRVYPDLYDVDFLLNSAQVQSSASDILKPLRDFDKELTPDQSATFRRLLDQTDMALTEANVIQAQAHFRNAPVITLEQIATTELRSTEVIRQQLPRQYSLNIYPVTGGPLLEPITKQPEAISKNWQDTVDAWFLSGGVDKPLVRTTDQLPPFQQGVVSNITTAPRQDRIAFVITSSQPAPVYVKVSFFPRWRAYQNGQPVRLYQASPNGMVVYGQGNMELRYETPWYQQVLDYMGLIGLIWLISVGAKWHKKNALTTNGRIQG